ncbi:type III secretion inner membrane ring lipoprotein SctJ [Stenotrophomonas sp. PS02289]|uniref:type III secretion system inner membrane ring lipoprotein SctJ n=1 Tax=Stenotrophomonas sp. PS02289 TaxID=2991422 RepID=UPI00249A66C7|nr:type III secretion inner membrane ring lipoprotein SctJ [Stenotrophomonas sp. PS02289]
MNTPLFAGTPRKVGWVLFAMLALLMLSGCARKPLLEGLDERQANEVIAVLLRHNITAEKLSAGKGGYQVQVAQRDLPESIELIQRNDLPSAPRSQVANAFPADSLVSTPLGERARLISAVEQRLEESLQLIDGVQSTRVHLNYDASIGGENRRTNPRRMHVAAVVAHAPDVDEEILMQSIKRFLRNTFDGIDYDNVSVILTEVEGPRTLAVTAAGERSVSPLILALFAVLGVALVLGGWVLVRAVPALASGASGLWQRLRRRKPLPTGSRWRGA